MRPWLVASLTLVADQATKCLVMTFLAPGESIPFIPPILQLTYVQNTGAAFGLFKGYQAVFILLSVAIITWIVRELTRRPPMAAIPQWGSALVLGGAAGNLIDRLRFGHVVDFLDLRVWPVFNLGDSAITIGVTLLIWHALFARRGRGGL